MMIPGLSTLYSHLPSAPGLSTQPPPITSPRSLNVGSGITTSHIRQLSGGPDRSLVANTTSLPSSFTQPVFGAPTSLSLTAAPKFQEKPLQQLSQDDATHTTAVVQHSTSPEAMSIDEKEEGEVSEESEAPRSPGNSIGMIDQSVNDNPAQMKQQVPSLPTQTYGGTGTSQLASQRESAKKFILEWQRNGYTFAQLADEGLDAGFLRSLYHELHLKPDESSTSSKHVSDSSLESAGSRRLYLGNLAFAVTEAELREFFSDYLVESITIPVNPRTTKPMGYAFINMSDPSEAQRALTELGGMMILDRKVSIQLSYKLDKPSPSPDASVLSASETAPVPAVKAASTEILPAVSNGSIPVDETARSPLPGTNGASVSQEVLATSTGITTNSTEQPKAAPENRKEYIARLLAAKTKRPTPSANSMSPMTVPAQVSKSAIDLTIGDAPSSAIDLTLNESQGNSPALASVVLGTTNADVLAAKRKAQTELARLRLQALSTSKVSGGTHGNASGPPVIEVISLPASVTNSPAPPTSVQLPQSKPVTVQADSQDTVAESVENLKALPLVRSLSTVEHPTSRPASTVSNHFVASMPIRGSSPRSASPRPVDVEDGRNGTSLSPRPASAAKQRKRPLAGDFDEGPPAKMSRRPFGEVPGVVNYEDMIIEISDDESMDDTSASVHVRSSLPQPVRPEPFENSSRNTPTAAATSEVDRLRAQEEQILEMKRMIAEREMKRKAKLAIASRPTTPGPAAAEVQATLPSVPLPKPDAVVVEDVDMEDAVAVEEEDMSDVPTKSLQHLGLDGTDDSVPAIRKALTHATDVGASSSTAARTPARQDEISTRLPASPVLPALDASVNSSQAKMALLQAQMDALRNEMQQLAAKDLVVQELQQPGHDANGMPNAEVSNVQEASLDDRTPVIAVPTDATEVETTETPPKKVKRTKEEKEARRIEKAKRLAADEEGMASEVDMSPKPPVDAPTLTKAQRKAERRREKREKLAARVAEAVADTGAEAEVTTSQPEIVVTRQSMPFEGFSGSEEGEIVTSSLAADAALAGDEAMEFSESGANLVDATVQPKLSGKQKAAEDLKTLMPDQPLPAGLTKRAMRKLIKVRKRADREAKIADTEAIDQDQNQPTTHLRFRNLQSATPEHFRKRLSQYQTSAIEWVGSGVANVEMSSVQEAQRAIKQLNNRSLRKHEMIIRFMASSHQHMKPKKGSGQPQATSSKSGADGLSLDGAHDDDTMDGAKTKPESESEYEPSDYEPSEYEPSDIIPSSMTTRQTVEHASNHVDMSVDEIAIDQSRTDSPLLDQDTTDVAQAMPVASMKNTFFRPYISPLSNFRAYRHHPSFTGGFKCTTYFHNLDASVDKALCPFEMAGGVCNDSQCSQRHWHFKDLSELEDDVMIAQLGADNPGRDQSERQRFNDGLRGVITTLREENVNEPNAVATAISSYRRSFVNDPSRILNL